MKSHFSIYFMMFRLRSCLVAMTNIRRPTGRLFFFCSILPHSSARQLYSLGWGQLVGRGAVGGGIWLDWPFRPACDRGMARVG